MVELLLMTNKFVKVDKKCPSDVMLLPVVTSADLIAAGLQFGWMLLRRATIPVI